MDEVRWIDVDWETCGENP